MLLTCFAAYMHAFIHIWPHWLQWQSLQLAIRESAVLFSVQLSLIDQHVRMGFNDSYSKKCC